MIATALLTKMFPVKKPIIGMLHVDEGAYESQLDRALKDLEILDRFVDGVIVENYDWGYADTNAAQPEAADRIEALTREIITRARIPVGINLLPNDWLSALVIAFRTGARFLQLDHVTGKFVGCRSVDPEKFMHLRSHYDQVAILGGIHPKYYRLVKQDTPIADSARTAQRLADAVVVTGKRTGGAANLDDLRAVKATIGVTPVIIGSGLTSENAVEQLTVADGAIVGTAFKRRGVVPGEPIDAGLVSRLMDEVAKLR